MAKLKGIKKLNKAIANQLKPFGIEKAKLDDEFALYFEQNKVHYKLAYNEVDKWFNACVKEIFGYEVEYTFIISLLHEIGHLNTIDDLTDKEYNKCLKAKEKIAKQLAEKITPEKYIVIDNTTLEIDYDGGYIRKGRMGGDISGDYNVYNYSTVFSSGEKAITYKGDSQNEIKLAIWIEGEDSFCFYSETPITPGTMISYINAIS